jgi:60S ribosomal protein uL30
MSSKAVPVPETLLKKRQRNVSLLAKEKAFLAKQRKERATKRKTIFKRAEKYAQEYRSQERDVIRLKRQAKAAGNYYVEPEAKLILAVRIRGINGVSPRVKKILQLFRLRQINNAVFLKANVPTLRMLRLVEPYITYGYPNLKTVREMIYKRGYAKVHSQRLPITSNRIIEDGLVKRAPGIICIEDVIHEIFTVGPKFKEVNNFLWPFQFSSPNGGMNKKRIHFIEGGDYGNREDKINELAQRMN